MVAFSRILVKTLQALRFPANGAQRRGSARESASVSGLNQEGKIVRLLAADGSGFASRAASLSRSNIFGFPWNFLQDDER